MRKLFMQYQKWSCKSCKNARRTSQLVMIQSVWSNLFIRTLGSRCWFFVFSRRLNRFLSRLIFSLLRFGFFFSFLCAFFFGFSVRRSFFVGRRFSFRLFCRSFSFFCFSFGFSFGRSLSFCRSFSLFSGFFSYSRFCLPFFSFSFAFYSIFFCYLPTEEKHAKWIENKRTCKPKKHIHHSYIQCKRRSIKKSCNFTHA